MLSLLSKEDSKNLAEINKSLRIISQGVARLLSMDIKQLDDLGKEPSKIEVDSFSLEQIAALEQEDMQEQVANKLKGRSNTMPFWREDNLDSDELEVLGG